MTDEPIKKTKVDAYNANSKLSGVAGWYETALRAAPEVLYALTLIPLFSLAAFIFGICLIPSVALFIHVSEWVAHSSQWVRIGSLGMALAFGWFLFGYTSLIVVPIFNFPIRFKVKAYRGPYFSLTFMSWFLHNMLMYMVRYTFMEFIVPSPYATWFLRFMGMKIGRAVMINSSCISDPALITLEDKVTIGGSATIIAHYGMGGFLVISPVVIRKGATIGLRAIVMGGVEVGEGATVLANSVVLPKTKIPAGQTWGGVPAKEIPRS